MESGGTALPVTDGRRRGTVNASAPRPLTSRSIHLRSEVVFDPRLLYLIELRFELVDVVFLVG